MFDFSQEVDRRGTWCTQWDYVADRFGEADLLPFTISDMDFAAAPCILEALNQRLSHGVLGYSRWKNEAFLGRLPTGLQHAIRPRSMPALSYTAPPLSIWHPSLSASGPTKARAW